MAKSYKTPGVYIEEISLFPPSIAEVETAIPAFIGYTEKAEKKDGEDLTNVPTRIKSMLEYTELFGGPNPEKNIVVNVTEIKDNSGKIVSRIIKIPKPTTSKYLMYYSLQIFFTNGGGPCFIISVGKYGDPELVSKSDLDASGGLGKLAKEDEPTLIVFPDATSLGTKDNFYGVYKEALTQCKKLQDRFTIIDTYDEGENFDKNLRDGINLVTDYLKYGAAYYPFLKTTINYQYKEEDVTINFLNTDTKYRLTQGDIDSLSFVPSDNQMTALNTIKDTGYDDEAAFKTALTTALSDAGATLSETRQNEVVKAAEPAVTTKKISEIKEINTELYNLIKTEMNKLTVTLPPGSAMAGIYARVDSDRGVWKAPANVGLNAVIAPDKKITNDEQDSLNVHETGKSINVIRSFAGKGTLVWGARTLAGNDNEWRYIPVRRFFNFAEESIKKGTSWVVFEPNDANTWVRVKAMIENFLIKQWRIGALAGAKPEDAFFVKVGLGETMTSLDILEGRMNIEIGMAVVRPAEFIILKFSHKMQEA